MAIIKQTKKLGRRIKSKAVQDPESIMALMYNQASGAQKNLQAGHALSPLSSGVTDVSGAPVAIRAGLSFAIYNKSSTAAAITFGKTSAVASLAIGAVDANQNVGIPCKPTDWTYLSNNDKTFVISSSPNLVVFQVVDDTYIADEGQTALE